MLISECMTRDVRVASPSQTLRDAAELMAELDVGALPVSENEQLVGMITDRDIVVRGLAEGKSPDTPISEIMSEDVVYCFEDQSVNEVTRNMGETQVRRLPVVDRQQRLVGIVSLGDVALNRANAGPSAEALRDISGRATSGNPLRH